MSGGRDRDRRFEEGELPESPAQARARMRRGIRKGHYAGCSRCQRSFLPHQTGLCSSCRESATAKESDSLKRAREAWDRISLARRLA